MRKLLILFALFVCCTLPVFAQAGVQTKPNCGAQDDGLTHMPSDWNTVTAPGVGNFYTDGLTAAISGTATPCKVYQITSNTSTWPDPANPGKFCPVFNYYTVDQPFSADDKYLRLTTCASAPYLGWIIMNISNPATPTVQVGVQSMMSDENDGDEPQWDLCVAGTRTPTANMMYYAGGVGGNQIKTATITGVNTLTTAVLATESGFGKIWGINYPQMSYDCEHILFAAVAPSPVVGTTPIQLLVYDLQTNTFTQDYTTTCTWPGYTGGQPDNDCIHKYQITMSNNTIVDCNGNCHPGWPTPKDQSSIISGTDYPLWPDTRTQHHTTGLAEDGTTSMLVFVNDFPPTGTDSNNPCDQHLGTVWLNEADVPLGTGGSAANPLHCLFSSYWVGAGHLSWTGGPNEPWLMFSPAGGGSTSSDEALSYFTGESGSLTPIACAYKNNNCGSPSNASWTTYMFEMELVANDCAGNPSAAGCTAGSSGRSAYRLAWWYIRGNPSNFWAGQQGAAMSSDGRVLVMPETRGYQNTGCPAATEPNGTDGCSDAYIITNIFNAASGPGSALAGGVKMAGGSAIH